jgi:REP element-mobilizing transposase RayT
MRTEMHACLASILKENDCPALLINGTGDHVHILCALSRNATLAKIVGETKRSSSKWIKTKGSQFTRFQWQNGYGAFSVSFSNVEAVRNYIAHQEEHHKKMTFQDEFRAFLTKHGVELDERYLWD